MYFAPHEIHLTDGRRAILRSPADGDAPGDIRCRMAITTETDFLLSSPEDICRDEKLHASSLSAAAEDPNMLLLFCLVDGEIVGRMSAKWKPARKVCHRFRLGVCVMRKYWGLGIASALMNAAEDTARSLGMLHMELEVMANNPRARTLYERLGYRIVQIKPDAIRLPDGRLIDEYLMMKKL